MGHNMFTYCGSDPISRSDVSGEIWHIIAGGIIGAGVGALTKVVTNVISGEKWNSGIVTALVAGAVSGGLAASGVGLAGQIIGNATISMTNNAVDQFVAMSETTGTEKPSFNVSSMLRDGTVGALAGWAGGPGAGSKNLTKIGITNVKRTWNALTHKGVKEASTTLRKGLSYFTKNAIHIRKPFFHAMIKSSATVITSSIATNTYGNISTMIERRFVY